MLRKKYLPIIVIALGTICLSSCKKYLETKAVQTLSTPSSIEDLQALLDNPLLITGPSSHFGGTDEYYISYNNWLSRPKLQQQAYVWDPELNAITDWSYVYRNVYYANTVLFNLPLLTNEGTVAQRDGLRGAALFIRSFNFYLAAQLFASSYNAASAATDLGIVLRTDVDFTKASKRVTLKETYETIVNDLQEALPLLPATAVTKNRPTKAAGYALLAKAYLVMGNNAKAKEAADAGLAIASTLLDYNGIDASNFFPMPQFASNPEILYYMSAGSPLNANYVRTRADSNLIKSYGANDLRKSVYYLDKGDGTFAYRGSYTTTIELFEGLATDEVYLIKAEAEARLGNKDASMTALNKLLEKRWTAGMFTPLTATSPDEALTIILKERRKELVNRGTRWTDLRRLNTDSRYAVTIKRNLNGTIYELPPNDLRYTLLIPKEVETIAQLPQNPR